ncbi:serine hydrolase [Methanoregula sp.]|uniref:serine hydrolase n=1 Tax=Methanoregula sp. TaxID=2052170 RepID=UPI0023745E94|nr:serine hydrolase [Methanoregula sp.]MDD1687018.1 serine hydrolase [Methanoregula sp.]
MKNSTGCLLCLIVFALFVLSAGCTATTGTDIIQPIATPAQVQPHSGTAVNPQNETQLREFIASFDTYADQARQDWNVPGMAIAIVQDGKIVFVKGYGVKTAGGSDPVTTDTVFQIGSTSKAFTAALAAMEVDSGRMNWSDPVIRYVPDFQMKDPWVTHEYSITDSLSQRSGLPGYWGTDLAMVGDTRSDMIHALRYAEPVSSFRSEFAYQNLAFLVTAAAIEKTSHMSWEENLKTRIFTPLNMTSASTSYAAFRSAPDHTSLHTTGVIGNTTGPVVTDPDWQFNDFSTVMGPAGGINANVKDMATWTIFQLGNGSYEGKLLISPENMAYMHTPRTPRAIVSAVNASKPYYCQGWVYEEQPGYPSLVWHNGETLGNHAMVLMIPDKNTGIVILANNADAALPDALGRTFYNRYVGMENPDVSAESLKKYRNDSVALLLPGPVRPANATPPQAISMYTGSYTNDVYGTATVTEDNGNLTLTFGKRPIIYNLSPWDGNTFSATCPQWSPTFNGRVTFTPGPDATARQVTISLFAVDGNATFDRT